MDAITFLRNEGILGMQATEFNIKFEDGREENLVELFEKFKNIGSSRLFQKLDRLNLKDIEEKNERKLVAVCPDLVSANYSKAGTKVTMGAAGNVVFQIESGYTIPLLLLIDKEEYDKQDEFKG